MDNLEKTENAMDCGMEYCQYKSSKEDQSDHSLILVQSMSNACIQSVFSTQLRFMSIANSYSRIPTGNGAAFEEPDDLSFLSFSSLSMFSQ